MSGGGVRFVEFPYDAPKPGSDWVRFVCFSDTHGRHSRIPEAHRPTADVLLHAGDFTNAGEPQQVQGFAKWLADYPAAHKVVIAGNHDVTFHPAYYAGKFRRFHREPFDCEETRRLLIESGSCTYLEDSGLELLGYRIYGSPWQPEFCDWAFNLTSVEETREVWSRIPEDVDILITHGPPQGFGDLCSHGGRPGCPELLQAIRSRRCPVSLAGHIHEDYGVVVDQGTTYINASTCTLAYRPDNPPIVFDAPPPAELRAASRPAESRPEAAPASEACGEV